MRRIRGAIRALSILLVAAFVGLAVFVSYTVYTQSPRWLVSGYNTRLVSAKNSVDMGDITDRNGLTLATTDSDGTRVYASKKAMRRAVSQTVGDQLGMSGTGVESFHADTLLGLSGSIIDRTWQYLTGKNYSGDDIRLTIDATLATYISEAFPDKYNGAVAVINYKTGEILAMVSKPDYDPAALVNRQSGADESGSGYLNRCLQGQYAPGSVFKIVTLAAALENISQAQARTFFCEAQKTFGDGTVTCYGKTAHGEETLEKAFTKSCNVAFADLACEVGADALIKTAENMGFNDNFQFRDIVLYESSIEQSLPNLYDLAWTGVGQGKTLVTPLHMAMIAGAVANGGVMREPQLISQVTGVGGIARLRAAGGVYRQAMQASTAQVIKEYMLKTVESGTASNAKVKGYLICGKTGSAEISDDKSVKTNAWFVGFVDDESAPYAIAVVAEQAGTGGDVAAPLASKVLKKAISLLGGK